MRKLLILITIIFVTITSIVGSYRVYQHMINTCKIFGGDSIKIPALAYGSTMEVFNGGYILICTPYPIQLEYIKYDDKEKSEQLENIKSDDNEV